MSFSLLHTHPMDDNLKDNVLPNNKTAIIDKYNSLIEKTKGMLFAWLWYEQEWKLFYNKAYFNAWQKITEQYIHNQIEKSGTLIQELDTIRTQVESESLLNDAQKNLITSFIQRNILSTQYHQHAIYIEAEKAWYPLSNKDRKHHRQEILQIEDILYGKDITQLGERTDSIINKFHQLYLQNAKELTSKEKQIWEENILQKFPNTTKIEEKPEIVAEKDIYLDEEYIFDIVALLLEIEWFSSEDLIKINIGAKKNKAHPELTEELLDVKEENWIYYVPLSRKDKEIYEYFNEKGIGQKFKIIKKNLWSNSIAISKEGDKFKKNQISISPPEKNGKYNITQKILPIMGDHEISTHVNTWIGNFNNAYIRDPERSDLEEWIAGFNQKMAENKSIQEMYETGIGDIWMFLWENFYEHEVRQLLEIYFKLTKEKNQKIDDRARRIKMWVPLWEKWARRQDLTYGNGKEIIKHLEELTKTPEWIALLNTYAKVIYSTKLWYGAIKNVDNILDGIKHIEELEPNFPIFAGKIIYWKLFKWKLDKDKMLENDLRRFIHTDKNVTEKQKRLLVRILQLIKKYWEDETK